MSPQQMQAACEYLCREMGWPMEKWPIMKTTVEIELGREIIHLAIQYGRAVA